MCFQPYIQSSVKWILFILIRYPLGGRLKEYFILMKGAEPNILHTDHVQARRRLAPRLLHFLLELIPEPNPRLLFQENGKCSLRILQEGSFCVGGTHGWDTHVPLQCGKELKERRENQAAARQKIYRTE